MADLTEAEAAVYDRQIRVWGVDVQKRLSAARVLIAGCSGLAAEVAKNIVLAGVGNVALMDDSPASSQQSCNFLINADAADDVTAAEASVAVLQEMNPLVKVRHVAGNIEQRIDDKTLLADVDLLLLVGYASHVVARVEACCIAAGVKFYCASCRGAVSFFFVNLAQHSFSTKTGGTESLQYVPWQQALSAPWSSLRRRVHPLYAVLAVCSDFETKHHRLPQPADIDDLKSLATAACAAHGKPISFVSEMFLQQYCCGVRELAPVNAVVGGVLANDVVRVLSAKGAPTQNLFFFSIVDGKGTVENITA